jgi:hypothetical protein
MMGAGSAARSHAQDSDPDRGVEGSAVQGPLQRERDGLGLFTMVAGSDYRPAGIPRGQPGAQASGLATTHLRLPPSIYRPTYRNI